MSKVSFIEYNEKGFWIPESFIEVLSQYICETFENIGLSSFSENLTSIYDNCNANRIGVRVGMVDISLNDYIVSQSDKTELINVLTQTKNLIISKGQEISISALNQFENNKIDDYFKSEWIYPIKTQSLIATVDIIIQMLNGTWLSNNYSVYYQGFPKPPNSPEI